MPNGDLLQQGIRGKLRQLRFSLHWRLLSEGFAWLLLALVGLVFVTLAFDYFLHLETELRGLLMIGCLVAVGWVFWRFLLSPMLVPMDEKNLALLVERHYSQIGDRLVSAVEFSRTADEAEKAGMSRAMIHRMAEEANNVAAPLDFKRLVDNRGMLQKWSASGCALLLLAGFAIWQTDIMGLWVKRNVLFQNDRWPQQTYLEVQGGDQNGDFSVLLSDDLDVTVEVDTQRSAEIPAYVTFHAEYPSVGETEESVELQQGVGEDGRPYARCVKTFEGVSEEFKFWVTGGDDYRDAEKPHYVRLIPPPALSSLKFMVHYHRYTGLKPKPFDGYASSGVIPVRVGSRVEIVQTSATKPLKEAAVMLDGEKVTDLKIGEDGKSLTGEFMVEGDNESRLQMLKFHLVDEDGYSARHSQQFSLQVQADTPPTVDLRKTGVSGMVTPQADIPLIIEVEDMLGVGTIELQSGLGKGKLSPTGVKLEQSGAAGIKKQVDVQHRLDLRPMNFEPGQNIRIRASATDTLPSDFGGPNMGRSGVLSFRVVTPQELMARLISRQKELRLEFLHVIDMQQNALAKSVDARARLLGGESQNLVNNQLTGAGQLETSVGTELSKIIQAYGDVYDEMYYNRLGKEKDYQELRDLIIQPLEKVNGMLQPLAADIAAARAETDADKKSQAISDIARTQQAMLDIMQKVLPQMQKTQTRQEIANELEMLNQSFKELVDQVKKKGETKVGFEPAAIDENDDDENDDDTPVVPED
ncbi:MAG: hypothetical protein ACLFVU_02355 [Phycisphaerae bacterium]